MINVAIVGVGNNASALIQGVEHYRNSLEKPIGVLAEIQDYSIQDIQFVLGFDVNSNKVGQDLGEAIFTQPNCSNFLFNPGIMKAPVLKGEVLDGLESIIAEYVPVDKTQISVDVVSELISHAVDVVVLLLPTGSQQASDYYANKALLAGCAIVNGTPASVANNKRLSILAEQKGVPIIGDDVKSQVGATIIHRALANLFPMRGAVLDRTIQLDWGGGMDFANLTSNKRYEAGKRQSKTESVAAFQPNRDSMDVQISAVDFIPFLNSQKEAYMRLEGRIFGGQRVRVELTMQVEDNFNAAGILADAIRVAMIGKQRAHGGVLNAPSSFFMKRPPQQLPDELAKEALTDYLQTNI